MEAPFPEQLVSDADHVSLSRLVVEIGRGPAVPAVVGEDTDEFILADVGWRFLSRTFETLFAWLRDGSTILADSGLTSAESLDTIALLVGRVRGLAWMRPRPATTTWRLRSAAAFAESGPPGDRDNALGIDRIWTA